MYFIIWGDYDNNDIMEIEDKEFAEQKIAEIQAKLDLPDGERYGTYLSAVIEGKKLEYKTIEVTSKCLLMED